MNANPAEVANTEGATPAPEPKATQKPRVRAHTPHVAPSKAKSGKQARPEKKANKRAVSAKSAKSPRTNATGARGGSKTAKVLGLLQRASGATLKELMQATEWQAHSVRGFLSGMLRKKMGLAVTSTKDTGEERRYLVKA